MADPPALPAMYPTIGFWRGLVMGVGLVALVAVVALGIRGMWPAPGPLLAPPGPMGLGMNFPDRPGMRGPDPGPIGPPVQPPDILVEPADIDVKVRLEGGEKLTTVGALRPFIALALANRSGLLLSATDDGELLVHASSDLAPRGRVILDGPAYGLALDESGGRLFAAVGRQYRVRVNRLGDRETPNGDIAVYDVKGLLDGSTPPGTRLKPTARLELNAPIAGLLLSRDGRHLYGLTESPLQTVLMRADTATLTIEHRSEFTGATGCAMTLSPDGGTLYTLIGGRLTAFDPRSWAATGHVLVGTGAACPVAVAGGRVMLIERRATLRVIVVDVAARSALARWIVPAEGRPYLTASPDGKRVFLGASSVLAGAVWQFDTDGERITQPVVVRSATSDRHRLLRGPLFVSPDSRHVYFGNGVVLRTGA